MERQKKPWSEMTEEERQEIRESWKHTLPKKFDVFCLENLTIPAHLEIPGNLYVYGDLKITNGHDIDVLETLFVGHVIYSRGVTVGNDFIVYCDVDCSEVKVGGNFIVYGDKVDTLAIVVNGDIIVDADINSTEISVNNLLDCHDVDSNYCGISAPDFVCRRYEEEHK